MADHIYSTASPPTEDFAAALACSETDRKAMEIIGLSLYDSYVNHVASATSVRQMRIPPGYILRNIPFETN